MKKRFALLWIVLLLNNTGILAQPYISGGKTRHRFAQLTLGVEQKNWIDRAVSYRKNHAGNWESYALPHFSESRLIIGGTHFWGHADFYLSIPIYTWGRGILTNGVETGFKFYPWALRSKTIRPFMGIGYMPQYYKEGTGVKHIQHSFPFMAGFTWNKGSHLIDLGFCIMLHNSFSYYFDQSQKFFVHTKPFGFHISYKYMLETTLSAEKQWQHEQNALSSDTMRFIGKRNSWSVGLGISSAIFTGTSAYLKEQFPAADQHKLVTVFPEFALGYYFQRPDIHLNLVYRSISSSIEAFDFKQVYSRHALTFEGYKFFADYHGFAPFAGLCLSYDWEQLIHQQAVHLEKNHQQGLHPGMVAGWDIRPTLSQAWYLRTHVRYFPWMNIKNSAGINQSFDQVEINFIQLVVLPSRL